MEIWIHSLVSSLLAWVALPQNGLSAVFVIAFVSATFLPLGSEPAVMGVVTANPSLFWPAIAIATVGNTLGGGLNWWLGLLGRRTYERLAHVKPPSETAKNPRVTAWLQRLGPKACLLSWMPILGDPLCGVAGWLRLPFWPCLIYMAIGKFARYALMTAAGQWLLPLL